MYSNAHVIEVLIIGIALGWLGTMAYYRKLSPMVKRLKREAENIRGRF